MNIRVNSFGIWWHRKEEELKSGRKGDTRMAHGELNSFDRVRFSGFKLRANLIPQGFLF